MIVYVLFFAGLNESVFNVSIPQIAEQFQLLPSEVNWMITAYIVTFGIGQTLFPKLSNRYEIGPLMTFGILIYMISGLIGILLQQWFALVIIVRAIQGIGASAIKALAVAGCYVTSTLHWSLLLLIPLFLLPAIPLLLKLPKVTEDVFLPDDFANRMNNYPKFVVSATLQELSWNNSRLIKGNLAEEVAKLKQ